ncbi:MAG: UDP-3-O-(3-hydroxymyristoyl)glucosamine N-acyltransferase [Deltaproteobacteria bacterium]|nr:MAG: UDP-3-O-(3-hydroxymyristoyl)glucosamine N-acyltransferase [Deltaproteobacteria bacterium]
MRVAELAELVGGRVEGDGELEIEGLAPIDEAGPRELTFVANPKYARWLARTRAGAVLLGLEEDAHGRTAIRVEQPYAALVRLLERFDQRPRLQPGVHPTAVIAASAEIGEGAAVAPYAVIGENVRIGRDARIHPHVTIYPGVVIGDRFTAHAGAVVREGVRIGDDVTLQPGVVVGGDGFGYVPRGREDPLPIPQIGTVELGDRVEIGSNTTVDRAALGATRIGRGAKLDNLVMVAHGCRIGAGTMLAAQVGMAGSTRIGERVMAGGQVGFAGHVDVGDDVQIAAQSGVAGDVESGRVVAGTPAVEIGVWRRYSVLLRRLPELAKRLARLERLLGERARD